MKALPAAALFCVLTFPARAQGPVAAGFATIGEGFTSPDRATGIEAAYRMFSLGAFGKTCKESARPSKLESPGGPVALRAGEWFPLSRLVIVGIDRTGHVLRPLPISLEVEDKNPPLLELRTDRISEGRLMPVRAGKFRFHARTLCEGTSAAVTIQAVIRPR